MSDSMKNLESYIRENREDLDHIEEPEADLIWLGVQDKLTKEKRPVKLIVLPQSWAVGIAASLLLLIGIGIWLLSQQEPTTQTIHIADYLPEIAEQEKDFQRLIAEKETELNLSNINPDDFQEIFLELQLLEEVRSESLKDVPVYNHKDQLVEILLKYYERKIRILERLSNEIEKKKQHENYHNEKSI